MPRLVVALLAGLAVLAAPGRAVAQAVPVPPPQRFSVVLWSGDAKRGAELAKAVGADALQLQRGGDPAALRAQGLGYYADQPIGKGLLEIRDEDWKPLAAEYERTRDPAALVRPQCLADDARLADAGRRAAEEVARVLGDGLRFVALADEPSSTRHDAPLDTCACATCTREFTAFLRRRWPTLDAINQVLGTAYTSFEDVRAPSTDQVRRRELGDTLLPADLRPFVLRRRFDADQYLAAVGRLVDAARLSAPGVPIGLTGLQPPAAFGGNDYARLLPRLTLLEPYDIGGAPELARALGAPSAHRYSTLFAPDESAGKAVLSPAQHVRAALSRAACTGQAGTVVWNDAAVGGAADAKDGLSAYGTALRDELAKLRPVLDACAGATVEPSSVWLLESHASVALWWMLDSAKDGMTWVRRLSSYERTHSTSQAARLGWLRLLQDLGLQPRFVGEGDLATRLLQERPRCLILPATLALSDRNGQAIAAYVKSGGVVLADHSTGLYDEDGLRREAGGLDELFGVLQRSLRWDDLLVREGKVQAALRDPLPAAEKGLRGRLGERRDTTSVFLEQSHGRGRAVYLNAPVVAYGEARLSERDVGFAFELRRRVRGVLQSAGVEPVCDARGEGLPTCIERIPLRLRDGRAVLAVRLSVQDNAELLARIARTGGKRVQLTFARERTARMLGGDTLGTATTFDVPLDPCGAAFLELVR
ncbi:MAG: hypothetical protein RL398_3127 [Planctomycetota bacterium]